MEKLQHTEKIKALLAKGAKREAARLHNARVKQQLKKAQEGQTINLSDLLAAREQLEQAP